MSRTMRHNKITHGKGARDHQSCAPCWLCLTGTVPKRGARKRERRDGKMQTRENEQD